MAIPRTFSLTNGVPPIKYTRNIRPGVHFVSLGTPPLFCGVFCVQSRIADGGGLVPSCLGDWDSTRQVEINAKLILAIASRTGAVAKVIDDMNPSLFRIGKLKTVDCVVLPTWRSGQDSTL